MSTAAARRWDTGDIPARQQYEAWQHVLQNVYGAWDVVKPARPDFNAHEGITVQQHIIRQRLSRCRRELEDPKMAGRTITDIAFSWGFQNSTHFSRRFKAEFGMSPQDFRAEAAAGMRRRAAPVH